MPCKVTFLVGRQFVSREVLGLSPGMGGPASAFDSSGLRRLAGYLPSTRDLTNRLNIHYLVVQKPKKMIIIFNNCVAVLF